MQLSCNCNWLGARLEVKYGTTQSQSTAGMDGRMKKDALAALAQALNAG